MTIGFTYAGYGFVSLGGLVVLTVHGLERLGQENDTIG